MHQHPNLTSLFLSILSIIEQQNLFVMPKTVAITLPADGTVVAFFGALKILYFLKY